MSTVMKNHNGLQTPPHAKPPTKDEQLRRDRVTAVITLVIIMTLMGLVMWLASMTGGGEVPDGMEYWPLMP